MFLEISQNSQENTCSRVSFLRPATLLKKWLWYRCFPVNFEKFLRTSFLQNTSGRLLLLVLLIFNEDQRSLWVLSKRSGVSNRKALKPERKTPKKNKKMETICEYIKKWRKIRIHAFPWVFAKSDKKATKATITKFAGNLKEYRFVRIIKLGLHIEKKDISSTKFINHFFSKRSHFLFTVNWTFFETHCGRRTFYFLIINQSN